MQHEVKFVIKSEDDTFAESKNTTDFFALDCRNWRLKRAEQKYVRKPNLKKSNSNDSLPQRLDIHFDVWQFGQWRKV